MAQPHLRRVRAILQRAAPKAEQVIKWNAPFFVEPRFLFGFSAYKAHLSFAPTAAAIKHFERELGGLAATQNTLKIPYLDPFLDELVRRIAEHCVKELAARKTDLFW